MISKNYNSIEERLPSAITLNDINGLEEGQLFLENEGREELSICII